ncbi:MAG: hypothetical protein WDN08_08915 [Rhizomicrobium sp.]
MKTHAFTIVALGMDTKSDDFEDRFYNAGCDDATISLWKGAIILEFAREAPTFDEALASALADVRRVEGPIKMEVKA